MKSKINRFLILLILTSVGILLSSCAIEEIAKKAEEAFNSGRYDEAISEYKKIEEGNLPAKFFIGQAYFRKGDYQIALSYFNKALEGCLKGEPCFIPAESLAFSIGRAHYELKDYDNAEYYFSKAVKASKENPDYPHWRGFYSQFVPSKSTCLKWLGFVYHIKGEYLKATEALNESIKLAVEPSEDAFIILADSYKQLRDYDKAIAAVKRAIEINPNNSAAYGILGRIYQEQKKYKEAEENFKKAIALESKLIPPYWALADLYYEKESYNEAVNILTKALEINPSSLRTYVNLLFSYMALGNFDKAIEIANKGIGFFTITGVGLKIDKKEGNYPVVKTVKEGPAKMAGIEPGDKIIKIDKQSTKDLKLSDVTDLLRGEEGTQVTLIIKRDDKEFEKTITRETMIDKRASVFFAKRSLCYREKGNLEQAIKDAEKAYALSPNLDETKEALGAVYIDRGRYDEAINVLSLASKDNNFAKILLATAYAKAGKFNEALNTYTNIPEDYLITKSVLRNNAINALHTALKPYKNNIAQQVKTFESKGQYKEAIEEYVKLLKIADEKEAKEIRAHIAELMIRYPHLFALTEEARKAVIKAEAYTQEGKFEKAIEEYKNALRISPFFPALYKALALNYAQIKEYKKAIKNMNIYLELYPDAPDLRQAKDQIYKWEFLIEKGE